MVSASRASGEPSPSAIVRATVQRFVDPLLCVEHAMSATAALTSNAEHDLLVGNSRSAISGLAQAWQSALHDLELESSDAVSAGSARGAHASARVRDARRRSGGTQP